MNVYGTILRNCFKNAVEFVLKIFYNVAY